mmetsp:Transcript_17388/g.44746  ORF Transcript_17388/g.44746 Transcript_17388/m.44746 type:complete len:587 (+) Transcript_17388:1003-2763(+)
MDDLVPQRHQEAWPLLEDGLQRVDDKRVHRIEEEVNGVQRREPLQQQRHHALDAGGRSVRQEHVKVHAEEAGDELADAGDAWGHRQRVPEDPDHRELRLVPRLPDADAFQSGFVPHDVLLHTGEGWRHAVRVQVLLWPIVLLHEGRGERQVQQRVEELGEGGRADHGRHQRQDLRGHGAGMPRKEFDDRWVVFREDGRVQQHLRCVRREKQQRAHGQQLLPVAHRHIVDAEVVQHRIHVEDHVLAVIHEELQHRSEDQAALAIRRPLVDLLHRWEDARDQGGIHQADEVEDPHRLHGCRLRVLAHPVRVQDDVLGAQPHLRRRLGQDVPLHLRKDAQADADHGLAEALVQAEAADRIKPLSALRLDARLRLLIGGPGSVVLHVGTAAAGVMGREAEVLQLRDDIVAALLLARLQQLRLVQVEDPVVERAEDVHIQDLVVGVVVGVVHTGEEVSRGCAIHLRHVARRGRRDDADPKQGSGRGLARLQRGSREDLLELRLHGPDVLVLVEDVREALHQGEQLRESDGPQAEAVAVAHEPGDQVGYVLDQQARVRELGEHRQEVLHLVLIVLREVPGEVVTEEIRCVPS